MARVSKKNKNAMQIINAESASNKKAYFKAALYARISMETEENRERGTIETQMELMKNFVEESDDIEVQDMYFDASFSGTNFDRPEFERMIQSIKAGKVNCVIVKDLSRLGRNYVEAGEFIERVFPFLNVRFIAITDDYDSFRKDADLMVPLKNIVNEFYAKDISKKVATAKASTWSDGKFNGSNTPYGYIKSPEDKHRLIVDKTVMENVIRIFKLFIDGYGYAQIAKKMTDDGVINPVAYRKLIESDIQMDEKEIIWKPAQVKRILMNQYYVGDSVHGKERQALYKGEKRHCVPRDEWIIYENTHRAIISRETFGKAEKLLEKNSNDYEQSRGKYRGTVRTKNLFTGKIKCADCGASMTLRKDKKGDTYSYICMTYVRQGIETCISHCIDKDILEQSVLTLIRNHMKVSIDSVDMIRRLNAKSQSVMQYDVYTREITRIRRELQIKSQRKAELYGDYCDRLIDEEQYLLLMKQYEEETEISKKQIDELLLFQFRYSKNYHINEDWDKTIKLYLNKKKLTQNMVDAFVSAIVVSDKGKVKVHLLYDDVLKEVEKIKEEREADNNED